jgi:hypothetical protein
MERKELAIHIGNYLLSGEHERKSDNRESLQVFREFF